MKALLITLTVLYVIGLASTSRNLQGSYPRQRTISKAEDAISLLIQIGGFVWVLSLLLDLP